MKVATLVNAQNVSYLFTLQSPLNTYFLTWSGKHAHVHDYTGELPGQYLMEYM